MRVRTTITIDKSYFITALTYYFFIEGEFYKITKGEALEIVRNRVYWSGKGNWHGDVTPAEALGDGGEAIDEYNALRPIVKAWVEKKFPNLKST